MTVNFLSNNLNGDDSATYGALDLGGQSTQIAFASQPSFDILAEFTVVRLWQSTYRVYTHSFLTFGVNSIESKIAQLSYDMNTSMVNPCLNSGYNATYSIDVDGSVMDVIQFGSSDIHKCREYMIDILLLNNTECFTKSCSMNNVYQPKIPTNMIFIAFSVFGLWVENCGLVKDASLEELYNLTVEVCSMSYGELIESKICNMNGTNEYVWSYCRVGVYMNVLLHNAYGFPLDGNHIWFTTSLGNINADVWFYFMFVCIFCLFVCVFDSWIGLKVQY